MTTLFVLFRLSEVGQTIGNTIDPDAQFTNAVIKEYVKYDETGREGDGSSIVSYPL